MTDGWLMEADCIHGNTWYECTECVADYYDPNEEADRGAQAPMAIVRKRDHFHACCPQCEQLVGDVHRSVSAEHRVAVLEQALADHRCSAEGWMTPTNNKAS
jgi:hypothetical protein